ncbi:hypothetical protein GOV14_02250 [Candidatus Pacearchaeota archaeon]|nr:hypothetical protein [Candidatus Pacearchaeota archaeon]
MDNLKKGKQIKKAFVTGALILAGLAQNVFPGTFHSSLEEKEKVTTKTQQNVNLEDITKKIKQKYPKKDVQYFSRGFLQFSGYELVQDDEINKSIQQKSLIGKIDSANLSVDSVLMIDPYLHHIGDGEKDEFIIPKPEGTTYEKKFTLKGLNNVQNVRIAMEAIFSDSENKVYLNGHEIGIVPSISKKKWRKVLKRYRKDTPFIYGELNASKHLKQGENIIKIVSNKPRGLFKSYDDFMIRRVQLTYSENKEVLK